MRTLIALIVVMAIVLVGYTAFRVNSLETNQRTLGIALIDSTSLLSQFRATVTGYATTITRLRQDSTSLSGQLAAASRDQKQIEIDALSNRLAMEANNQTLRLSLAAQSAAQLKRAADEDVGGVGAVGTSVTDSMTNRQIAELKGQNRQKDTTIAVLTRENTTVKRERDQARGQVSELENIYNHVYATSVYAEDQFVREAQTKRFLGTGRKKAALQRAAAVRANRLTGNQ